jgi:hypothetical protein
MAGKSKREFEYRPLEDSPRAMLILLISFSLCLVAVFALVEAFARDDPIDPWWGPLATGIGAYAAAFAARAPFRWRPPRKEWWIPFASIFALVLVKLLLKRLLEAGPAGAYAIELFFGLMLGYVGGVGVGRFRLVGDGPTPSAPPRFVWQLRTPKPDWRRAEGEPPDPPYRGY